MANQGFQHQRYLIRKKVLKLLGGAFHIYDSEENVVFYSRLKAFKLKEDIRLFTGEDMATEVLTIKARSVLDFGAAYDVVDSQTGESVGVLKRKALKSFIQDEWAIMDTQDNQIGTLKEDSMVLALVRRFLSNLVPQSFVGEVHGQTVCNFKRRFNPFILKMELDFSPDQTGALDRRLGIAAAILLTAIEGRQD